MIGKGDLSSMWSNCKWASCPLTPLVNNIHVKSMGRASGLSKSQPTLYIWRVNYVLKGIPWTLNTVVVMFKVSFEVGLPSSRIGFRFEVRDR